MVAPDDAPDCWLVHLGPGPALTERRVGPVFADADWRLDGSAASLYLALWNRARRPGLDAGLRDRAAVTWG